MVAVKSPSSTLTFTVLPAMTLSKISPLPISLVATTPYEDTVSKVIALPVGVVAIWKLLAVELIT